MEREGVGSLGRVCSSFGLDASNQDPDSLSLSNATLSDQRQICKLPDRARDHTRRVLSFVTWSEVRGPTS